MNFPGYDISADSPRIRYEYRQYWNMQYSRCAVGTYDPLLVHLYGECSTGKLIGSCPCAATLSRQGAGNREQRARTASARRGFTSSGPPSGAPYLDTRFVHSTTPPIVPPLDFTNLTNGSGTLPIAQHYYVEGKQPRFPTPADAGKNQNSGTNNRTWFVDRLQAPSRGFHYANGPPPLIETSSRAAGHALEGPQLADHDNVPILERASFQAPGLSHPRPPDVPLPTITKDKGSMVGSGRESLSARLARLSASGSSSRVVPLKLV